MPLLREWFRVEEKRVRGFLRILGGIYLIAFVSFGVQALGLIGSRGVLPTADYLSAVRASYGARAFHLVPTLLWISSSDAAITALWVAGAICSAVAIAGFRIRAALAGCLVLWLSICAAGQEFLSFQWDALLVEAGFLGVFADATAVRVWLFRWLVFRLMFSSGIVKLLSHDPTWASLTAMHYHYETQPLPTPLAWLMNQLPMLFQRASTAFVFLAEIPVPFLFLAQRRFRILGAWITIALQCLILLTGNYAYFNLLTILLAAFLFIEPERRPTSRMHRGVSLALVVLIGVLSVLTLSEMFSLPLPEPAAAVMHAAGPLRIVNTYGLFAVMTTTRPEIIIEGSDDEVNWKAYEFRYKPGDPRRAPPIVAPHQPRLDWQMWFVALGAYQQNPWFTNLMIRLLQGEPAVLRLLAYNPFPKAPPKYIRADVYEYHFTRFGEPGWWKRERKGRYFPVASLK